MIHCSEHFARDWRATAETKGCVSERRRKEEEEEVDYFSSNLIPFFFLLLFSYG